MTLTLALTALLATATFPDTLASLSHGPVPGCTLCHQGPTARGTVTTLFGTAMRQKGLQAGDETSLKTAFAALGGQDSDGDGTTDVEELKAGTDPNLATGHESATPVPEYGCSSAPTLSALALLCSLALRSGERAGVRGRRP